MEFTKEGFIKAYDEYIKAVNQYSHADSITVSKKRELVSYGKNLLKENPNNKEIACIVYSGLPLGYSGMYENLSDELKNDKLTTLFALNNFDSASYGKMGDKLKSDRDVMFAFASNTEGISSAAYFSENLKKDEYFWEEVLTYAYIRGNNSLDTVLYKLIELDKLQNLNLDFNVINAAATKIKEKGKEKGDNIYSSHLATFSIKSGSINPHFIEDVFQGNVEKVEERIKNSDCSKYIQSLFIEESQKARNSKIEVSNTQTEDIKEEKTTNQIANKKEELEKNKELVKALSTIAKLAPELLSQEQKTMLEKYFSILDSEETYQTDNTMSETPTLKSGRVK